jgi:hypothetical protein
VQILSLSSETTSWKRVNTEAAPEVEQAGFAFDETNGELLVFGGIEHLKIRGKKKRQRRNN